MKKKAIISLAAGEQQLLVINKAREMGYAVIAVDRDSEAPGFAFSDEKLCLSAYEPEPIIDRLQAFLDLYEFKAVLTRSSGPAVISVATIAQAFGLPGITPQVAETMVYKTDFIKACHRNSIPAPRQLVVLGNEEFHLNGMAFPCIVKPALSLIGQKAVQFVKSKEQLSGEISEIREVSFDDRIEIESFEPGYDIILVAMVSKGKLLPFVLLDEINHIADSGKIERQAIAGPSVFTGTIVEDRIHAVARNLITALEIDTTPFLLSCRSQANGFPKVIECHLDLGGDRILDLLLPAMTEFDFVKFVIDVMTGQPFTSAETEFEPSAILFDRAENEGCRIISGRNYHSFIKGAISDS